MRCFFDWLAGLLRGAYLEYYDPSSQAGLADTMDMCLLRSCELCMGQAAPEGLVGSRRPLYNNTPIRYMTEHMPHLETRRGRVCRCRVLQVSL